MNKFDNDIVRKVLEATQVIPTDLEHRCNVQEAGYTCTMIKGHRGPHIAHGTEIVCEIWEDEDKVWKAKMLKQFWTINNITTNQRFSEEQVDNYIDEAEHGDGYGYWEHFSNGIEVYADILLYFEYGGS